MLVSNATRKIDLPHEEGQFVEVRDLTRKQIKEARRLRLAEVLEMFGGNIPEKGGDDQTADTLPVDAYDIDYVLEAAIVAWSYDEPVDKDSVARLDQETAEYVARDLLGIEEDGARKKG